MKEKISTPVAAVLIAIAVIGIGFVIFKNTAGKSSSSFTKTPPPEAQKWLPSNTMKNSKTGSQAPPGMGMQGGGGQGR